MTIELTTEAFDALAAHLAAALGGQWTAQPAKEEWRGASVTVTRADGLSVLLSSDGSTGRIRIRGSVGDADLARYVSATRATFAPSRGIDALTRDIARRIVAKIDAEIPAARAEHAEREAIVGPIREARKAIDDLRAPDENFERRATIAVTPSAYAYLHNRSITTAKLDIEGLTPAELTDLARWLAERGLSVSTSGSL